MNLESMPLQNEEQERLEKQERLGELATRIAEATGAQAYNNANAANISPEAYEAFEANKKALEAEYEQLKGELDGRL